MIIIIQESARVFLNMFWSVTDTNAWLHRGQMYVFSLAQVICYDTEYVIIINMTNMYQLIPVMKTNML